jgi:Fe-S-cluster containining protein
MYEYRGLKALGSIHKMKVEAFLVPYLYRIKFPCPFLNKKNLCIIYEKRPLECRKFPFHFEEHEELLYFGIRLDCPKGQKIKMLSEQKVISIEEVLQFIGSDQDELMLAVQSYIYQRNYLDVLKETLSRYEFDKFRRFSEQFDHNIGLDISIATEDTKIPLFQCLPRDDFLLLKNNAIAHTQDLIKENLEEFRKNAKNQLK